MTPSPPLSAPPAVSLRQDARTIGLVGLAHGASHFFHLLLPPLFPWLISEFGFSYSELGLLVSVFFVVSGVGQALSGFLVDRVGARPILFGALLCFAVAGGVAGMAQGYNGLLLAAALAGLGNAPFHPVDFTILNKRVSPQRLGHGFAVHGISGNLGWALSPVFMTGITTATGSWRIACVCGGLLALLGLLPGLGAGEFSGLPVLCTGGCPLIVSDRVATSGQKRGGEGRDDDRWDGTHTVPSTNSAIRFIQPAAKADCLGSLVISRPRWRRRCPSTLP